MPDKTVMLAGDSTVAGGVLAPGDRLDVRLGCRLAGPNAGHAGFPTVLNKGVGGQFLCGAGGLAATWPTLIAPLHPGDVVSVLIGMNDLYTYAGDSVWTTAYVDIVTQAQATGLTVYVGQITPVGSQHWNVELLRQHLNQWLLDHFGSTMVLRYPDVLHNAASGQSWLDPHYDSGDGTHPNAWGTLYMADMIAGRLLA
jgi:lysophospholipase L1-like esterase